MSEPENVEEEGGIIQLRFSTFKASRLKGFSDSLSSIIATIVIVPTMHVTITAELKKMKNVDEVAWETMLQIFLFFVAFHIVCSIWTSHVWTFQTMRYVTNLSISINVGVLLTASFVPYFYILMVKFRSWETIIVFASIQIAIGLFQLIIVLHAFSYPHLLTKKLNNANEEVKHMHRKRIITHIAVIPAFAIVSICLSFAFPTAAIVTLGMTLFYPWVQSLLFWTLSKIPKCRKIVNRNKRELRLYVNLTERIKKDRIEAFGDGVFAITATLLALDLTEKYLPTEKTLSKYYGGDAMQALADIWGVFLAYVLAFLVIASIWYTHLYMFKNYEKISRLMLFLNNWILACVGALPPAFTFVLHFRHPGAIKIGIRFGSGALFFVGVFTALMYIVAMLFDRWRKNETWVSANMKPGGEDFGLAMFQLIVSPLLSAIVFGLTFLPHFLISAYVAAPLLILYSLTLLLWKTIRNSCFEQDPDRMGEYSALKRDEETEAGGTKPEN